MTGPPLRVCYVIAYFYPLQSGAERQAFEQGRELVRQGHHVHVVTRAAPGLARDECVDGIQIHRWVKVVERRPFFAPTFVSGVVGALRRLRHEIDLVHTHQALWEAVATGLCAGWIGRIPVLVQPASSGFYGEAEELMRTRGRRALRALVLRNTHFAAISADIERQWRALGVEARRIDRMASGVDTTRFHPGPSDWESRLPPRPRVLFTGRLHPQKNLRVLIQSWPAVSKQVDAHLCLAGEGVDREAIANMVASMGLSSSVHLLGAVDDVAPLLRATDVFVLPSKAEGMSNSLLEAMATGLPCLASNIGGNQDLIEHGETGVLLDANNPDAWSEALCGLLRDEVRRLKLGENARLLVSERYALPIVVERYVSLYRRVLGQTL